MITHKVSRSRFFLAPFAAFLALCGKNRDR
jgi:hypothetical protein